MINILLKVDICLIDGGNAFHNALAISGEPPTETIFGSQPSPENNASQIMKKNIEIREYRKAYLDYWNSTAGITETGRPVDAIILPLFPGPPPAPGKIRHFGMYSLLKHLHF